MDKQLLSVGLDVGTTSTQLIFSKLAIENRAGSFSVPEDLLTALADLLEVFPMLIPPLMVPPDVLVVVLPV